MICRSCGSPDRFFVVDTRSYGDQTVTTRRLECACGRRWTTLETEKEGSAIMVDRQGNPLTDGTATTDGGLPVVGNAKPPRPVAATGNNQPLPVAGSPPTGKANPLPVVGTTSGGVGGGLSGDPIPGQFRFLSDPPVDPLQQADPARVNDSVAPEYPSDFEAIWRAMKPRGGRGNKDPAFRAWKKRGRPSADVLVPAWNRYIASLADWQTQSAHISRWLNVWGWRDEYKPATGGGRSPGGHGRQWQDLGPLLKRKPTA